jgi:hypothetical protein
MYAPNPAEPGSSVSHFSTACSPNELMEPMYTGPLHAVSLARHVMTDIGWGHRGRCADHDVDDRHRRHFDVGHRVHVVEHDDDDPVCGPVPAEPDRAVQCGGIATRDDPRS